MKTATKQADRIFEKMETILVEAPRVYWIVAALFVLFTFVFLDHLLSVSTFYSYVNNLNVDDSFYYYKIARNLAEGAFSTFDGIHPTSGHHPLWTFFLVPVYLIEPDIDAALPIIKSIEIGLLLGAGLLFIAAARFAGWSALLFTATMPLLLSERNLYRGLETALSLFVIALTFAGLALLLRRRSKVGAVVLAASLFVLPFARLENIVLSLVIPLSLYVAQQQRWTDLPARRVHAVAVSAVLGLVTYGLYHQLLFGAPVPVSGLVKTAVFSPFMWEQQGGRDLLHNISKTWAYAPYRHGFFLAVIIITVAGFNLYRLRNTPRDHRPRAFLAVDIFMVSLALGHLAKLGHSALFLHVYFAKYGWYLYYFSLMKILIGPYAAMSVVQYLLPHAVARNRRIGIGLLNAAILIIAAVTPYRAPFVLVSELASHSRAKGTYLGTMVMNAGLPEDAVIGAADAGLIGYYSKHTVINLDGLVNTKTYFDALKEGTAGDWIAHSGITHLANVLNDNQKDGTAEMSREIRQRRPLPGSTTLLYEGPTIFRPKKQFKLWTYAPDARTKRPEKAAKGRFFNTLFENAEVTHKGRFDIYLKANLLGFRKTDCTDKDIGPRFIVAFYPENPSELPPHQRQAPYLDLGFEWRDAGFREADTCMATVLLPPYGRTKIVAGQVRSRDREGWRTTVWRQDK